MQPYIGSWVPLKPSGNSAYDHDNESWILRLRANLRLTILIPGVTMFNAKMREARGQFFDSASARIPENTSDMLGKYSLMQHAIPHTGPRYILQECET